MATNKIEVYQHNSQSIGCVVLGIDDVSGYIPYLTVKKKPIDATPVLTNIGAVADPSGTLLFNLTPSDTSLAALDYVYDITIEKDGAIYTVVKDTFTILEGVKY